MNKDKCTKLCQIMEVKKINYTKASDTGKGLRIKPQTIDDYRRLRKLMDEQKLEYFTHQLKTERNLKIVIRCVMTQLTMEEIVEDLNEAGYPPLKVSMMNGKLGKPAPLVLVEIDRKFNSIYKLNNLCGLTVTVEALKPSGVPTQCHRCQKYGHIQKNCTAEFVCMKCADKHSTHECVKARTTAALCATCNGEHTSNYHKCPQRPNLINKRAPSTKK